MALAQVNPIRNQERLRGLRATPCDWLNALPLCYMQRGIVRCATALLYERGIVRCATALLYERGSKRTAAARAPQ